MDSLPPDILVQNILASPILSIEDIFNVAKTAQFLQTMMKEDQNWLAKTKFNQRLVHIVSHK